MVARRLAGRLRFAHFPLHKTLEDFDFDAQPSLDRRLVDELATLRFVEEGANLLCVCARAGAAGAPRR
jgi:DNA replication protein DnaC